MTQGKLEKCQHTIEETEGTIEEALEATGIGRFNVWITITAGLVLYTVNCECWSIGYVIPAAECDLNLNLEQKTILVTAGSVGITTTQYFWGYLSDKIGRRNVMLYTLAAGCVCTIISALVPIFWMLALCRFLNGVFVACSSGLIFAYIGEFFSARYRSIAIFAMSIFIGLSLTVIPALTWLILPVDFSASLFGNKLASWRVFLLATALPAIPACIFLYFSPESPKFLAQVQRNEEAIQLLQKIRRINKTTDTKVIQNLKIEENENKDVHIWELFKLQYIFKTILVCTIQGGVFATSGGLFLWYPDILQKISKSKQSVTVCEALNHPTEINILEYLMTNGVQRNFESSVQECDMTLDSSVYFQNILIGLAYTVGYTSVSVLVKFVEVKRILIAFLGLAGAATFSLHFIKAPVMIDVLFLVLLVMSGLCVVVVNAAVVEMYPTNLRGVAVCLTMLSGRVATILASSLVGYLLLWNCDVTFMMFAASLTGCSLLSLLLPASQKPNPIVNDNIKKNNEKGI